MATFDSKGEFCVGDTTIQTTFRVKVNDYEVELPEIHAFGPTGFQDIRLAYIINWVERGIIVEFENIKEEEKATFFIIEYNKYAKQVNDEEGKVVYRLALVAQNWLIRDLHWEERIQGAKQSDTSHAIKDKPKINPFKPLIHRDSSKTISKTGKYTNDTIRARFAQKNNAAKQVDALKKQLEMHDFDIFSQNMQEPDEIGATNIDGIVLST